MLNLAQAELGWPAPDVLFNPPGSGAAIIADLAKAKIEQRIRNFDGGRNARVGIITADPHSRSTQAPIALVCEFTNAIPVATLRELHILAWNFSRTPLLVTIEPHRIRAFSCCEKPERELLEENHLRAEIAEAEYLAAQSPTIGNKALALLHWLNLSSGVLQRKYPERFDRRGAADNTLLDNLNVVREKLHVDGLEFDLIHDLLARLIFIQFLFQRCDSNGTPALNPNYLKKLHQQGVFSQSHQNLGDILNDHGDTYALFRYLNDRFNGDLFPGKADSEEEREQEWRREMESVDGRHLQLLRSFVIGEMKLRSGQYALWPLYSFDTIPLEFVSSIYEAFVTRRKGTVYTPVHLVDFVLDGVLPWEGNEWDLKILDPACGSGIFLVRAFQRLAHRWKNANPNALLRTDVLKRLLMRNLVGVDIDPHAVRVASFSLYLAMCDELDPRHYWQQIRFPKLRGERLIIADFFSEETPGINTENDAESYDLVVGNPPWAKNLIKAIYKEFGSNAALEWSERYDWPISIGDPSTLFVAKALRLAKPHGLVSLLQPTQTLLLNQTGPALVQRHRLFSEYKVIEAINLSALRFGLFKKAVGPSTVITITPEKPQKDYSLTYVVVKPSTAADNDYRFVIDSYDVHSVFSVDAANNPVIWTALTWGGPRDVTLLKQLSRFPTVNSYKEKGLLKTRRGVIRGDRKKIQQVIVGRKLFAEHDFSQDEKLLLDVKNIPVNEDPETDGRASTDLSAFEPPQVLVKIGWRRETGRFRAVAIAPDDNGVLCSDRYVSVSASGGDRAALESACVALNSRLATYYLLLASGQFSNYRDTTNVSELLSVPCPEPGVVSLSEVKSFKDADNAVIHAFKLKDSERVLIDDIFEIALSSFKDGETSIARAPTRRTQLSPDAELKDYLQWFLRVLNATFGENNTVRATLFEESGSENLPIRLVAIHLDWPERSSISIETINEGALANKLTDLYSLLSGSKSIGPVCYRRVARFFDSVEYEDRIIPTIFIAKPDEKRYWTRSIAMRDADEVASEIMAWNGQDK